MNVKVRSKSHILMKYWNKIQIYQIRNSNQTLTDVHIVLIIRFQVKEFIWECSQQLRLNNKIDKINSCSVEKGITENKMLIY